MAHSDIRALGTWTLGSWPVASPTSRQARAAAKPAAPVLQPADEVVSFEEALAEHEELGCQADNLVAALDSAMSCECPSATAP